MSVPGLPDPIRTVLEVETDELRTARGWRGIQEKQRAAARRKLVAGGAGALALAAAAWLAVVSWTARAPGPLEVVGDASLEEALGAGEELALDDGSVISPERGARLEPLANDGARFTVLLRSGAARFSVRPGGPRRWTVEAGLATVEVVGTVFVVDRRDDGVHVRVERGEVLVRGDTLPDRVARVRAGGSVRVPSPPGQGSRSEDPARAEAVGSERVVDDPTLPPSAAEAGPATGATEAPTVPAAEPAPAPRGGREAARAPTPSPAPPDDSEAILAEADAARRGGDPERALALLARVSARAGDPHAALAALSRGRLALELDRPSEAVEDLQRAAQLGRPALAETARARLVEAHARAGDRARARVAADDYLARYPEGPWREMVERWSAR